MTLKAVPSMTRCATCRHPFSFHPKGGPCKAVKCGAACKRFKSPPQVELVPEAPEPHQITEALDVLTAVIQRSARTTRPAAAARLEWLINAIPSLRSAARGSDRSLLLILADCRQPAAAPQTAEVAPDNDDAQQDDPP